MIAANGRKLQLGYFFRKPYLIGDNLLIGS